MPTKSPQELFLLLLSHVRQNTERTAKAFQNIGQAGALGPAEPVADQGPQARQTLGSFHGGFDHALVRQARHMFQ